MKKEGQEALAEIHAEVAAVKAATLDETVHPIAQGAVIPTGPTPSAPVLNPAYSIDLKNWTMGDYMDFQDVVTEGIFRKTTDYLVKIIKKWPHAGNPSEFESYR